MNTFNAFVKKGQILSFQNLQENYNLDHKDFYMYLQVRDFYHKVIKPDLPGETNKLTEILDNAYKNKGEKVLSKLYQALVFNRKNSTLYIRDKWEKELLVEISDDVWYDICETQLTTTSSRNWKIFCWKNIVRFFITPKIKKASLSTHQPCWRLCGEQDVGHAHIFWQCTKITQFWNNIWEELGKILGYKLPMSCSTLYFGSLSGKQIPCKDKYLIKILLAASKKSITRKWCKEEPPTVNNWRDIVEDIHNMERLTYILRLQQQEYEDRWEKWTKYIVSTNTDL